MDPAKRLLLMLTNVVEGVRSAVLISSCPGQVLLARQPTVHRRPGGPHLMFREVGSTARLRFSGAGEQAEEVANPDDLWGSLEQVPRHIVVTINYPCSPACCHNKGNGEAAYCCHIATTTRQTGGGAGGERAAEF